VVSWGANMESESITRDQLAAELPEIKDEIDKEISELLALFQETNPLELLSRFCFNNLVASEHAVDVAERSEASPEYLISLALTQPFPEGAKTASPEQIQRCFDLTEAIFIKCSIYLTSRVLCGGDPKSPGRQILSKLVLNTLNVRGDGFYHHMKRRFEDVIQPHDDFFAENFGFTLADFHRLLDRAEVEMNRRIEEDRKEKVYPLQRLMKQIEQEISRVANPEELKGVLDRYAEDVQKRMFLFNSVSPPEIFEVSPDDSTEERILATLSSRFGENTPFLEKLENWRGWPLNPSILETKPFIEQGGRFYLFHLQLAGRSAFKIFDDLAARCHPDYRNHKFLKGRDNYSETTALSIIESALPGSTCHRGLFYAVEEDGRSKMAEVDGLVIYDDNLIVVEAKAHGVSSSARRGSPDRLISDIKKSLDESHQQASRLLAELDRAGVLRLSDEKGKEVCVIKRDDFVRRFIISVSFDLFPIVGVSLPGLRDMGLISGDIWPWAVALDDLRVAVDLLDRPSFFLHYLLRRARLNDFPKVEAIDELDLVIHYVRGGLFFDENPDYEQADRIALVDHTAEVELYYRRVQGSSKFGKKLKVPLSGGAKRFIDLMETHRPKHFSTACLSLLEYDTPAREQLLGAMNLQIRKLRKEEKGVFAGLRGDDRIAALYFAILPSLENWADWAEAKCMELLMKYRISHSTLVMFTLPIAAGKCEVRLLTNPEAPLRSDFLGGS
jgi:hypothetical protein